jgi:excisionase family DNA binding protein
MTSFIIPLNPDKPVVTVQAARTTETPPERVTVSVKEAAVMLGICERTVWKLEAEGKLKTVKAGRRKLFPVDSIRAFAAGTTQH